MSRMRVLSVNLHLTEEGVLAAVMERHWVGARKSDVLIQRVHISEVNIDSRPAEILHAVAALFDLQNATREDADPSS